MLRNWLLNIVHSRIACLLAGLAAMVLFGALGLGRGGPSSTNLDMGFLYLAGLQMWDGLTPYKYLLATPLPPHLQDVANRFDFAYPPHLAPLCLLLAGLPLAAAKLLMTAINCGAALTLGWLSVLVARERNDNLPGIATRWPPWPLLALVMGNFATAYVIWGGQTSLLVALALLAAWRCCDRGRPILGGILLGIATIKPQLLMAVMLWLLLERRWRTLAAAAATALVLGIVPIAISGPIDLLMEWIAAIKRYSEASYNAIGSRTVFGLQSFLRAAGTPAPTLIPLEIILVAALWRYRANVLPADILALLVGISLLLGYSHDYDLAFFALMTPALWGHVQGRLSRSLLAFGLFFIVTSPNGHLAHLGIPLLTHARELALLVCVIWLYAMSARRVAASKGSAFSLGSPLDASAEPKN